MTDLSELRAEVSEILAAAATADEETALEFQLRESESRAKVKAARQTEEERQANLRTEFEERREADFKAKSRTKYSNMSDTDFDRLWPELRDRELIAQANATAAQTRESVRRKF